MQVRVVLGYVSVEPWDPIMITLPVCRVLHGRGNVPHWIRIFFDNLGLVPRLFQ